MDFISVFKFLLNSFEHNHIDFALIGGFALQSAGVSRTTRDIDMLVHQKDKEKIKELLLGHGYELLHESEDVLNFLGKKYELGRLDFLLAHRKYSLAMLKRAEEKEILGGKFNIKVIKTEDLIGLKIQSSVNDPERAQRDMDDVRSLIKTRYPDLNLDLVREYFGLFKKEKELDMLIREMKDAE